MANTASSDRWVLEPKNVMEPFGLAGEGEAPLPMLDFRGHNGTSFALPYSQLQSIAYDPMEGVSLEFREHKIRLHGRNLRPLYDHLLLHRVTFVQEEDFDATPETETFIDRIIVERMPEIG